MIIRNKVSSIDVKYRKGGNAMVEEKHAQVARPRQRPKRYGTSGH